MTEHKMTAKKVLDANTANGSRMDEARVLNAMKEFALQVATEAVEEEKGRTIYSSSDAYECQRMRVTLDKALKNIKKRLNDKNCEEG